MTDKLFIVAGMPRGGTTFLYHYLNKHPSLFLPSCKEVNYYTVNWEKGPEWYKSLYTDVSGESWCGDISPPCFLDVASIERIKSFNPNAKIIFCVRKASDYALSFYSQLKTFTYNMPSFEDFVADGYKYVREDGELYIKFKDDYVVKTVVEFMDAFGDNILLYKFDHFSKHSLDILKRIEQYLGVDPYFSESNFDNLRINASSRRNLRFLSKMLQSEKCISAIQKVFPHRVILRARSMFDKMSAKNACQTEYTEYEKETAVNALGNQDKELDALFADVSVMTGDKHSI